MDTPEGRLPLIKNITLNVTRGEALVIKGASGSGKTTLLGMMAGLDEPSSGELFLFGESLIGKTEEQRSKVRAGRVGFVFQSFQLVQGASALQNVVLPLELSGVSDAQERARKSLDEVGLSHRRDTLVEKLSGGEQQRVSIARAFAVQPELLLADEPTGNLDAITGRQVADIMFNLRDQTGTTLVLVTHEDELARRGDRQIDMQFGELLPN